MDNIQRLQEELIKKEWNHSGELISYLIKESNGSISIQEIKEMKQLADIQLKHNSPLKKFI